MSLDRLPFASIEDEDQDSLEPSSSAPSTQSETYMVGFIEANIVGHCYYSGRLYAGETVGLVREPFNALDSNAIRVVNTQTIKVGHIKKKIASVLAPLIDSNLVHVEGTVRKTPNSAAQYTIPFHIHVFAKKEAFEIVKSACGQILFSVSDPLFSTSESMVVKENKKGDLDKIFKLVNDNLSKKAVKGVMEPPRDIILPELLLHQKEGLYWLHHRENSDELPPFWEERDEGFVNLVTNYQSSIRPQPLRGGIFADEMGLGKTLTLLSLIALDKSNNVVNTNEQSDEVGLVVPSGKRSRMVKLCKTIRPRKKHICENETVSKMTLIVCPPSVFSTWVTQLTDHTKQGRLKAHMYYGNRTQDVSELQKYDIILTTFSTLGSELRNMNAPIKKIEWWRVILDEAHVIKNHDANQSIAVTNLNAKRRWVVTGTPIQNGSMDLFSLMAFLRFEPFSNKYYWDSLVQRPISEGIPQGLSRLKALMATISLSRTKEKVLIGLPPKTIHTCNVELSLDERTLYDEKEAEAKRFFADYIAEGSLTNSYVTTLTVILRLRKICTHTGLLPRDSFLTLLDASNNRELLKKLVLVLHDEEDLECPICISPPSDMIITSCTHIFCRTCIIRSIKHSKPNCPFCRRPLTDSDIFSAPPEVNKLPSSSSSYKPSSKVAALLKLLEATRDEDPSIKSVVFSQFHTLLLLLEEPLEAAGFKTVRLDGEMNAKRRAKVIDEFRVAGVDGPTVLLASLKAAGTGINLTAASRVYLMEPWWNPAVEEQAIDRVHRIGQKRDVKVVKMIAKDSIDERILLLQEKKRKLAKEAFRKKGKDEKREISVDDLRTLMLL